MAGTWAPYAGSDALVLTAVLFALAAGSAYLGSRLRRPISPGRPGRAAGFFLIAIWVVSLLAFVIDSVSYGYILKASNLVAVYQSYTAPNPVSPVTDAAAAAAFVIIVLLNRKYGIGAALLGGLVGAASGAMIFELPFDLIVLNRIYPPIPPAPLVFRLLFFLPLFLLELSTMSFLTFSRLTRLSKYTLYSLAGFLSVLGVWAAFGFPYPSDPLITAFNDISKVVAFVVAASLFVGSRELIERKIDGPAS